jgi:hypothetical protein
MIHDTQSGFLIRAISAIRGSISSISAVTRRPGIGPSAISIECDHGLPRFPDHDPCPPGSGILIRAIRSIRCAIFSALREAKAWLRGLSRSDALAVTANLSGGVERGKGIQARQSADHSAAIPAGADNGRPYASPHFWAAFVLAGDPD